MSKSYIATAVRRLVVERANGICEYCLIPTSLRLPSKYHIDHVISEKHGGETNSMNLALACASCNLAKGSDIASKLPDDNRVYALYNPRLDSWHFHFKLNSDGQLDGITPSGTVTINLLGLNDPVYCEMRMVLLLSGMEVAPKPRLF